MLIESYDKGQFSGAFLIDDGNQNGQSNYNGKHIRYGHSEEFSTWEGVVQYIVDRDGDSYEDDKYAIPPYLQEEASKYADMAFYDLEEFTPESIIKVVQESMEWAFGKMKESNPPGKREGSGHNYVPPFYKPTTQDEQS